MPDPATLGVFALASLVFFVVPGPSVIYIVTRSITQGRMAGIVSLLGVALGATAHIAAAALGLSALLVRSVVAFNVLKYAGAAYLVYVGIGKLFERDEIDATGPLPAQPLTRIFRQGVVVNLLNPKTALFFLAFLPQFVDVDRGSVPLQMMVLGSIFILLGILSDGTYALVASQLGDLLRRKRSFARRQRLLSACIYIGLGLTAAFSGGRSGAK